VADSGWSGGSSVREWQGGADFDDAAADVHPEVRARPDRTIPPPRDPVNPVPVKEQG
jgi:hypothetical protein